MRVLLSTTVAAILAAASSCAAPRVATDRAAEQAPAAETKPAPQAAPETKDPSPAPVNREDLPPEQRPALVVIDPGHGGIKFGARNRSGAAEKDITLAVSLKARDALKKAGVEVLLTRESDVDISLGRRVGFANDKQATLFVSIHANSWPEKNRRGCEVYILAAAGAKADSDAAQVEAQEEDYERDYGPTPKEDDLLETILGDLAESITGEASALLALRLESRLSRLPALSPGRGLRQARFAVLRGAKMPAALVELGYLTHDQQGAALASPAVAEAAGDAVARGIQDYLEEWKKR